MTSNYHSLVCSIRGTGPVCLFTFFPNRGKVKVVNINSMSDRAVLMLSSVGNNNKTLEGIIGDLFKNEEVFCSIEYMRIIYKTLLKAECKVYTN